MKRIFLILVLLLLAVLIYALAASNTVPGTGAGSGSGGVTGYTVTNVEYNLRTTNPMQVESITFDISGASGNPGTVKISVVTGTWVDCGETTAPEWECNFGSTYPNVADIANLSVVATD